MKVCVPFCHFFCKSEIISKEKVFKMRNYGSFFPQRALRTAEPQTPVGWLEEYKPKIFTSIIYGYIIKTLQNSVALLYYLSQFRGSIGLSWEFCFMWCQMKLQSFGSPLGGNIQDGTLPCLEICWGWLGGGGQKWAAGMASFSMQSQGLTLSTWPLHVTFLCDPCRATLLGRSQ